MNFCLLPGEKRGIALRAEVKEVKAEEEPEDEDEAKQGVQKNKGCSSKGLGADTIRHFSPRFPPPAPRPFPCGEPLRGFFCGILCFPS